MDDANSGRVPAGGELVATPARVVAVRRPVVLADEGAPAGCVAVDDDALARCSAVDEGVLAVCGGVTVDEGALRLTGAAGGVVVLVIAATVVPASAVVSSTEGPASVVAAAETGLGRGIAAGETVEGTDRDVPAAEHPTARTTASAGMNLSPDSCRSTS